MLFVHFSTSHQRGMYSHILIFQWRQLIKTKSIELALGSDFPDGKLPNVTDLWSIPDFEWAARNFLNNTAYAWIRYGTGAEYTYKNNMEVFPRVGFKPRVLTGDKTSVNMSMQYVISHHQSTASSLTSSSTTILGNHFDAPIFISPAAAPGLVGGYVPEHRELGLVQGAGEEGILYIPALYAEMTIEEMGKAQLPGQSMFQQVSLNLRYPERNGSSQHNHSSTRNTTVPSTRTFSPAPRRLAKRPLSGRSTLLPTALGSTAHASQYRRAPPQPYSPGTFMTNCAT